MENNIYQAPQADLTTKAQGTSEDQVTPGMVEGLEKGGKWAKFLAVLGYIGLGFLVLAIVFMLIGGFAGGSGAVLAIVTAVFYGIYAFIIFKMSRFLHQYSAAVKALSDSYDPYDLIESQEFFARYMKWMAVIIIIAVIFSLVFLVIGIAGGMSMM